MILIPEGEQTIYKGFFFTLKSKMKKQFFSLLKIIIIFIFIAIFFLLLKIKSNINRISDLSYLNKYLNQKIFLIFSYFYLKL